MVRFFVIITVLCSLLHASQPVAVALSGTVKDNAGAPVKGVNVTLVRMKDLSTKSGDDGTFTLSNKTSILSSGNMKSSFGITFQNNAIIFSGISDDVRGTMSLHAGDGRLIINASLDGFHAGQQRITLPELSTGMYLLKVTVGGEPFTRSLVCMGNAHYLGNGMATENSAGSIALSKSAAAAVADTIIASIDGYDTTRVALTSYSKTGIEIVMNKKGVFTITSTKFVDGDEMPDEYTCEGKAMGDGIAPPLEWSGVPAGAKSLALFFKDLTMAASSTPSYGYHWGMWNIPVTVTKMPEGLSGDAKPAAMNGAEQKGALGNKFFGPCPDYNKKGGIKDTYAFILYAFEKEKITPPTNLQQMDQYFDDNDIAKTQISVWSSAQPK
ncbi:MAG: hypothetical protein JW915_14695 [Chitinispirillaceae bacterium]|nr:hypothetical protein [Chitinispirillaceae bacterium]